MTGLAVVEVRIPRILMVEDDRDTREVFQFALSLRGLESDVVTTCEMALWRFLEIRYDAVFIDGGLRWPRVEAMPKPIQPVWEKLSAGPGPEGVSLLRFMRVAPLDIAWKTDVRTVPVAVVSAHDSLSTVYLVLSFAGTDFVRKPFDPEKLVEVAKRLCLRPEG